MLKKERIEKINKLMLDVDNTPLSCGNFLYITFDGVINDSIVRTVNDKFYELSKLRSTLITMIFNDLKKDFDL